MTSALDAKLQRGACLIIIGTEGALRSQPLANGLAACHNRREVSSGGNPINDDGATDARRWRDYPMGKIFVSYLRRDKDQVARLVKQLTDLGADIWWDEDALAVGDPWRDNIELAISECDYFIPCFSAFQGWHTSTMAMEVRIAAGLWRSRAASDSKWILPVKLEDCPIPNIRLDDSKTLEDLHWIRLDGGGWDAGISSILDIVLERPKKQARQELRKKAEEAARATAIAGYAQAAAGMSEQAKPGAARSEENAKQRQNEYLDALSAYTRKYNDYGFVNEIETNHIYKEVEKQYISWNSAWIIFLICGFLLITAIRWIGGVMFDWMSRLFHAIF